MTVDRGLQGTVSGTSRQRGYLVPRRKVVRFEARSSELRQNTYPRFQKLHELHLAARDGKLYVGSLTAVMVCRGAGRLTRRTASPAQMHGAYESRDGSVGIGTVRLDRLRTVDQRAFERRAPPYRSCRRQIGTAGVVRRRPRQIDRDVS